MPDIISREQWGARPATSRQSAAMDRGVGIHWLGPGAGESDHGQCAAQMRQVQAFHMGPERQWGDFAYNAAVCSHGSVFVGRGPNVRNAANGGGTRHGLDANAAWGAVLYLAGIDGPGLTPPGMDAINDAAEFLGLADGEWLGHRDFLNTECPGDELYRWVQGGHPRSTEITQEVSDMFTYSTAPSVDKGSIWLVVNGVAHRLHLPEDHNRIIGAGVPNFGEMSESFHNLFSHSG